MSIAHFSIAIMRNRYRFIFAIAISLFAGALYGQDVKIPAIPRPLRWENMPKSFTAQGNSLVITAGEKTDMFRDPNVTYNTDNAPKLMFRPDDDFVLTVSVEHAFENKWDGGAIVLKQDSLHWIKFCYEKDYTGARRVVSVVTKDISDDCNSVSFTGNRTWFKMAKAGKVITLYCGENGRDWFLVRHLQFETRPGFEVGFLAQSPTGKQCTVTFSEIRYEARKIKDPYLGE
jgi:regulation of enolase protein 1 (concanavalin A-like superfamily)